MTDTQENQVHSVAAAFDQDGANDSLAQLKITAQRTADQLTDESETSTDTAATCGLLAKLFAPGITLELNESDQTGMRVIMESLEARNLDQAQRLYNLANPPHNSHG